MKSVISDDAQLYDLDYLNNEIIDEKFMIFSIPLEKNYTIKKNNISKEEKNIYTTILVESLIYVI
jgi:hypothetical protein